MDKRSHIYILDVLQQCNAIDVMVDIRFAFESELESQEGRKNLKAQLDYLVNENLIETGGKFEFLGWELLNGLYPIGNKKIEARLVGNWESYLESKRGILGKREIIPPPAAAMPAQTPTPRLADLPTNVLPYPGVHVNTPPKVPAPVTNIAGVTDQEPKEDDTDFLPFKAKSQAPAPNNPEANYLTEDDFLPFKVRNSLPKAQPPVEPQPEPVITPETPLATEPEPVKVPDELPTFSASKISYTPPKTGATLIKPVLPPPVYTPPEPEKVVQPPTRITGQARKPDGDDDAPIITARTAGLRPKQVPAETPQPEPVIETPPVPVQRVIKLNATDTAPAPLRNAPQARPANPIPPSTVNYAAIRFDTDNNPFAGLGNIPLENDDATAKKSNLVTILKWTVFVVLVLALLIGYSLYKKKYS